MKRAKKLWSFLIVLALCAGFMPGGYVITAFADTGSYEPATLNSDGVYEIGSAGQLFWFAALVNGDTTQEGITAAVADADGILTADIDLESKSWTPIGDYAGSTSPYYGGTFDGRGYTISNLYINNSASRYQGLFGYVRNGTVQNVTVSGSVTGRENVGIVVGDSNGGTITNCSSSGNVTGYQSVGGVVGHNVSGTVTNCSSSGSVTGQQIVGGVVGYNENGTVTNCSNSVTVSSASDVGGVVGGNSGTVTNCSNSGTISCSSSCLGGVVGVNSGSVKNCCNSGNVSGHNYAGGVVGRNMASVSYCYNSGNVSIDNYAGGVVSINTTSGTVSNCYYLNTTASAAYSTNNGTLTNVESKTDTLFASGEVTWLLTGGVTDGTQAWYQTLGLDSYPVLDSTHGTVYYTATACTGGSASYSNSSVIHVGYDADGFCTNCGGYQPAERNSSGIYEISNAGQLFWFAALVNGDATQDRIAAADTGASAVLKDDIDLDGREWVPIGTKDAPYAGTFDGGSRTVSGMSITTASNYMGLFGYVSAGEVKNLTVSGEIDVSGSSLYAGGIVGMVKNGVLSNLTSNVNVTAYDGKKGTFGGVAATVEDGSAMELCVNNGEVTASGVLDCVGGIVGYMNSATIVNCANYGVVDTSGGTAAASAGIYTGGIVSYINNANAVVKNCLNIGKVSGVSGTVATRYTGAIVGRIRAQLGEITNTYYLDTSADVAYGADESGAELGMTAKTEAALASGEVAWLLNGGTTDGTQAWHQTLGMDSFPILDSIHCTVYYHTAACDGSSVADSTYSNSSVIHAGYDADGFCTNCGGYKSAEQNGEGVYEIGNSGQLYWFAALVNGDVTQEGITAADTGASAVLTDDVDLDDREWVPIGTKDAPYAGTFDGGEFETSGLSITTAANYMGLFGYVSAGTVKNLTVSGEIDVSGSSLYAGGIVGTVKNGTLSNLTSNVNVTAYDGKKGTFGGVAATVEDGSTMELCENLGTVTASGVLDCVGGLVGYMNSATITNCANYGAVDTSGGTAAASAGIYTGGIVSYINNANAVVENCLNIGKVSGVSGTSVVTYTGAIVGRINKYVKEVSNCYYLSTSASAGVGGNGSDVTAETAAKDADALASGEVAYLLQNGESNSVWGQDLENDAYPTLYKTNVVKLTFTDGNITVERYANVGIVPTNYPTPATGLYAFYTNSNMTNRIDTSSYTFTADATVYMAQMYTLTQNLTNVTSDNTATEVMPGSEFTANLTAADGYVIKSVTVTMGNSDITNTAYSNGTISISSVSGDIVITAFVAEKTFKLNGVTVNENFVVVDITNTLGKSGVVIAAAYDADGVMIDMASAELPTGSGSVSMEIDTDKAATVKAFVWESVETMVPLCGAISN